METTSRLQYYFIRIPFPSPRLVDLATKFRATKLAALESDPTAFAVQHAEESSHPITLWEQRLAAPTINVVCIVMTPEQQALDKETLLLSGNWVGTAFIRGPLPYSVFHIAESEQPVPEDPSLETRWHLGNVYISPAHRGRGLAKKIVHACIDEARQITRELAGGNGNMQTRVRLFCDPTKTQVVSLYRGLGFQDAGKCTLQDAFVANGDAVLVPNDWRDTEENRARWDNRYGLAMERLDRV